MKRSIILSFYFTLLSVALISQAPIYSYIKYRTTILSMDTLREKKEYDKIFNILNSMDVPSIPKDFITSYYAKFSEYYLNKRNKEKALFYAKKAVDIGLDTMWLMYLKLEYSSKEKFAPIVKEIKENYPKWMKEYRDKINWSFRNKADEMKDSDQAIRGMLHDAYVAKDTSLIKLRRKQMAVVDSSTERIYDSLCDKYGWIDKAIIGRSMKNYHIVIAHAPDKMRYKYVERGYQLCKENKIPWYEVISMESFAFLRNKIGKVHYIDNFIISQQKKPTNEFNEFIIYSLSTEVNDGGTYDGREKKIKLTINIKDSKVDTSGLLSELKEIKKILLKFNVPDNKVQIDESNYTTNEKSTENYVIGIEFI